MAAPLFVSADLRILSRDSQETLLNSLALSINQDQLGKLGLEIQQVSTIDSYLHSFGTYVKQTWNWVIESPGQWVIWVIFHVRVTESPGHRVIIFTRCETRVFSGFRNNAQNAKRTFEMLK